MWDSQKRQRFQQLRERSDLTDSEKTELSALTQELESAEVTYLNGASRRIRNEREQIETQNRSLEKLAARRRALVEKLESALSAAQAERSAIDSELAVVLSGSTGSGAE